MPCPRLLWLAVSCCCFSVCHMYAHHKWASFVLDALSCCDTLSSAVFSSCSLSCAAWSAVSLSDFNFSTLSDSTRPSWSHPCSRPLKASLFTCRSRSIPWDSERRARRLEISLSARSTLSWYSAMRAFFSCNAACVAPGSACRE
ncbi:hypothetical protein B484DRAFT_446010 [Ochromonadaceae sp. CCMP2298]|nr:hypothetical protein B484DRAFT_446010 [Ochromonadaceae sp. CCMP2298]